MLIQVLVFRVITVFYITNTYGLPSTIHLLFTFIIFSITATSVDELRSLCKEKLSTYTAIPTYKSSVYTFYADYFYISIHYTVYMGL